MRNALRVASTNAWFWFRKIVSQNLFQDRKMPCFHENLPISSATAGIAYRATQRAQDGGVKQDAENTVDTNEEIHSFGKALGTALREPTKRKTMKIGASHRPL